MCSIMGSGALTVFEGLDSVFLWFNSLDVSLLQHTLLFNKLCCH